MTADDVEIGVSRDDTKDGEGGMDVVGSIYESIVNGIRHFTCKLKKTQCTVDHCRGEGQVPRLECFFLVEKEPSVGENDGFEGAGVGRTIVGWAKNETGSVW